jgi:hypothetical protein
LNTASTPVIFSSAIASSPPSLVGKRVEGGCRDGLRLSSRRYRPYTTRADTNIPYSVSSHSSWLGSSSCGVVSPSTEPEVPAPLRVLRDERRADEDWIPHTHSCAPTLPAWSDQRDVCYHFAATRVEIRPPSRLDIPPSTRSKWIFLAVRNGKGRSAAGMGSRSRLVGVQPWHIFCSTSGQKWSRARCAREHEKETP